jgi:hypothetical protein
MEDNSEEGDKLVGHSACKTEGTAVTGISVISGNFESHFHVDIRSSYNPPLDGRKEAMSSIDAKWIGPCKPGQKPGDIFPKGMLSNPSQTPSRR